MARARSRTCCFALPNTRTGNSHRLNEPLARTEGSSPFFVEDAKCHQADIAYFLSRRMFSRLSRALRVIVSKDGVGVAMDALLASDNDNPAAPRTGTVFRLEVRDTEISGDLQPASPSNRRRIRLTSYGCIRRRAVGTRTRVVASTFSTRRSLTADVHPPDPKKTPRRVHCPMEFPRLAF